MGFCSSTHLILNFILFWLVCMISAQDLYVLEYICSNTSFNCQLLQTQGWGVGVEESESRHFWGFRSRSWQKLADSDS